MYWGLHGIVQILNMSYDAYIINWMRKKLWNTYISILAASSIIIFQKTVIGKSGFTIAIIGVKGQFHGCNHFGWFYKCSNFISGTASATFSSVATTTTTPATTTSDKERRIYSCSYLYEELESLATSTITVLNTKNKRSDEVYLYAESTVPPLGRLTPYQLPAAKQHAQQALLQAEYETLVPFQNQSYIPNYTEFQV